tara:strand:- start:6317 stop:7183 length:867 start_codon:yes stop_codon:yes gene_type:complete
MFLSNVNKVSYDDFIALKNSRNNKLHKEFTIKFQKIQKKFQSLSPATVYKKIQKTNFISKSESDSILNILNKLTINNFDTISEKISLKVNESNFLSYTKQILDYSKRSTINAKNLWYLMKMMLDTFSGSTYNEFHLNVESILLSYIDEILKQFDIDNNDLPVNEAEDYSEFLERNRYTSEFKNKIAFMFEFLKEDFIKHYNINVVYGVILEKTMKIIQNSKKEHLLHLILECILIIIPHENLKTNPYAYNKFLMLFDNDDIKKNLKNKIRFKLLDITDYIKNAKSQLS